MEQNPRLGAKFATANRRKIGGPPPPKGTDVAITKEELGKLVLDYYENLDRASELEALLAQTSENMVALGTRLKSRPESITAHQEKVSFKDDSQNEGTIPLAALDIGRICLALSNCSALVRGAPCHTPGYPPSWV